MLLRSHENKTRESEHGGTKSEDTKLCSNILGKYNLHDRKLLEASALVSPNMEAILLNNKTSDSQEGLPIEASI